MATIRQIKREAKEQLVAEQALPYTMHLKENTVTIARKPAESHIDARKRCLFSDG
jgi:hypothetical protein